MEEVPLSLVIELCKFLKRETKLKKGRIKPKLIHRMIVSKRAVIIHENGVPVAFGALWRSGKSGCSELGTLWTNPDFRGRGFLSRIIDEILDFLKSGEIVFLLSRVSGVTRLVRKRKWGESVGWDQSDFWSKILKKRSNHPKRRLFYTIKN